MCAQQEKQVWPSFCAALSGGGNWIRELARTLPHILLKTRQRTHSLRDADADAGLLRCNFSARNFHTRVIKEHENTVLNSSLNDERDE